MPDISVLVKGNVYTGWKGLACTRSIESPAGSFSVQVSDVDPWPIAPGDECTVKLDGEQVIKGYVDKVDVDIAPDSHTYTVSGRDKSADMVDCSVDSKTSELKGQTIKQIAETIAKPFGVSVSADGDIGAALPRFSIQPGDTAWATVERAARMRGVLVLSDSNGGIVLTKPKKQKVDVTLKQGENILSASVSFDDSERYSKYIVRGQSPGTVANIFAEPGESSAKQVAQATAQVGAKFSDDGVKRNRPMIVVAESNVDALTSKQRAKWEATVRAARALQLSVKVHGWKKGNGGLWKVNELVPCDIPLLRIKDDLLVSEVSFNCSIDDGTTTTLTLTRPDAYAVEPEGEKLAKTKVTTNIFAEKE